MCLKQKNMKEKLNAIDGILYKEFERSKRGISRITRQDEQDGLIR